MSRCKACNFDLTNHSQEYWRIVKLEDGNTIKVLEDLCLECRKKVYQYSMPEDFDLLGSLGIDVDA